MRKKNQCDAEAAAEQWGRGFDVLHAVWCNSLPESCVMP